MGLLGTGGTLKLKSKKNKADKKDIPWVVQTKENLKNKEHIGFGHWAALDGNTKLENIKG